MTSYRQLDSALKFLSTYNKCMTLTAPEICEKSGIAVDDYIAGLIVDKLHDDNYVRRMDDAASRYQPKFNGKLFLDNGGYRYKNYLYRRNKLSLWFSDYFDMTIKPLSVLSLLSVSTWTIIKIIKLVCE